jgi:hypothetical protein
LNFLIAGLDPAISILKSGALSIKMPATSAGMTVVFND